MAEIDFDQKIEEALNNPFMPQVSREYLRKDTVDYAVSRRRLLKAAIRDWDEDQIVSIVKEISYLTGHDNAMRYFLDTWGQVVEEGLIKSSD
jgi:hypothetical protein